MTKPRTTKEAKEHPTLHERMLAVAKEASYVHRDASSGTWTAASYDQVVRKLRPWLLEHGVLVYPDRDSFRVTANGSTLVIETGLRFTNADDPQDFIVVPSCCMGTQNSIGQEQLAGKLQTYCYKAALRYGLLLETGDDPDLTAGPPVDIKMTPEIEAKVARVRELVSVIAPEDPESFIRDKLAALSAKYSRPVGFLEGMPEELLDGWIAQLEKSKKKADVPPAPRGNGAKKGKPSDSTPAAAPPTDAEVAAATPAQAKEMADEAREEQAEGGSWAPTPNIPADERSAHIIAWLSKQRPSIPQGLIRNAFGGWMFHAKHTGLADDATWLTVCAQRETILADLDKRVEAKA